MKIPTVSSARIILFGSEGGFSGAVLKRLLNCGLDVTAVVMVDSGCEEASFPVAIQQPRVQGGLENIAREKGLEVISTPALGLEKFLIRLLEKRADLFLVACFGHKIPIRIWRDFQCPCWNLHPSLLPRYRGPAPLYWQIQEHETHTGLSLHQVNDALDAGDIVAQRAVALPENADQQTLNEWVAEHGVALIQSGLTRYLAGTLQARPQDPTGASYFPAP